MLYTEQVLDACATKLNGSRTRLRVALCVSLAAGCNVEFNSIGSIRNACQMVDVMDVDEKICVDGGRCIEHNLRCDDASYSSKLSVHTNKDWPAVYKSDFKPSRDRESNANFNTYKKWGIGERKFFSISDNFDAPAESSRTLYFSMNYHNMPRLVGATFFDASTGQVAEYEFVYEEDDSSRASFSSMSKERKLVAERSFEASKPEATKKDSNDPT